MTIIGLELNDSGILAAGGSPAGLLDVDGELQESPGIALPQKKGLLVGKAAHSKAHFFPRQILNQAWDQLNTEPLEQTVRGGPQNNAEIVFHHLSLIWQQLQRPGSQIVMAVPSFYGREHLGLLLGIAQEIGMPVKGFVPVSLAAVPYDAPEPEEVLLYLDIHLHRVEVVYLAHDADLIIRDSATTADKGLLHLQRRLADMIAREFVRATRFDPLHEAASEQELYDRLQGILSHLNSNSSMVFEIISGSTPYGVTLERTDFINEANSVNSEILRLIKRMQKKREMEQEPLALYLSHRLAHLPGCRETLSTLKDARINILDRGAAAMGVLQVWTQLAPGGNDNGIQYFTSRPRYRRQPDHDRPQPGKPATQPRPTHLLYRSIAYPITEKKLIIGWGEDSQKNKIIITSATDGVSSRHCTIELQGEEIVLKDTSKEGILVDEQRVNASTTLNLGQVIQIGNSGEQLQMIACLNSSPEKQ
jgi:hypothetical protein